MKIFQSRYHFKPLPVNVALIAVSLFNNICHASPVPQKPCPVVAITQIAPHPSLNHIRQGIEDELKDQKLNCTIKFQDAQGSIATATQIAQKFVSLNPAVIVPITTPSAQTVYAAARPQKIPVVFAAVSDPVAARLVPDPKSAGTGITGVCDLPPVIEQVLLVKELMPKAKTVGVVYNPGESNSLAVLTRLEHTLNNRGLEMLKAPASSTADVAAATQSLMEKVDVIYVPNDNTVVSALESLLKVAGEGKRPVPVFASDPESVERGCLAAIAHDQYSLGRETGKLVVKLLQGTDIQSLPVESPVDTVRLSTNKETAKKLGIGIPENLLKVIHHKSMECPVHLQ